MNSRLTWLLCLLITSAVVITGCKSDPVVHGQDQTRNTPSVNYNPEEGKPNRKSAPTPEGRYIHGGQKSGSGHHMDVAPPPPPARPVVQAPVKPAPMGNRAGIYIPTGVESTSVLYLEKEGPGEVALGQTFDFSVRVTNISNLPVSGVQIYDLAEGFQHINVISSVPPMDQIRGGEGRNSGWIIGTLQPGETKVARVTCTAKSEGTITNCVTAVYQNSVCITTNVVSPKLLLEKMLADGRMSGTYLVCDDIPYKFRVTNNGTGSARNVVINDPLAPGLATTDGMSNLTINVGDLASGQSKEFTKVIRAKAPGTYTNTASASADGGLSAGSGTVTVTATQPVLVLTKSGPERRFIGRDVTYELTLTNSGDGEAKNTMVEDMLPAGATFVSASQGGQMQGGKVIWQVGTLAPGASRNFSVTVKGVTPGMLKNTASAKAYCASAVAADASTQVQGIPAILLEVIDLDDPIEVGSDEVYVITVTNQGSAMDTGIRLTVTLPDEQRFINVTGPTSASASGNVVTIAPLASLAPKAKAEWRVKVKAVGEGNIRLKVQMMSDQLSGPPVEETESTNQYQ